MLYPQPYRLQGTARLKRLCGVQLVRGLFLNKLFVKLFVACKATQANEATQVCSVQLVRGLFLNNLFVGLFAASKLNLAKSRDMHRSEYAHVTHDRQVERKVQMNA